MGSGAMARLALAAALLCLLAVAADISPDAEFSLAGGSPAQHGDRVAREAQPANRNAQQKKDKRISERQRLRQRKDMSKIKVLQKQKNKKQQDKRKMKTVKDATCRGPRVVTDEC